MSHERRDSILKSEMFRTVAYWKVIRKLELAIRDGVLQSQMKEFLLQSLLSSIDVSA